MTRELRTALRFGATGLANTVVGLCVVIATGEWLGWSPYFANAAGYAAGLSFGFLVNRRWTFADRRAVKITAPRYVFAFALSYGANLLVLTVALRWLGWHPVPAQTAALLTYSVTFYLLCRHFVFSPRAS